MVTATSATGTCHGPDHLVAADHAADGAIADGNQEGLVGHRRETQQAIGGFAQIDARQRQRRPAAASRGARRATSSAPCLATPRAACPPGACRCCLSSSTSTPVSSISPITANGQRSRRQMAAKSVEPRRIDDAARSAPATRCTTVPSATCRARRSESRARSMTRAATRRVRHGLGHGVRQAAGAHVVNQQNGIVRPARRSNGR